MKANAPEKLYVDVHDNLSDSIFYGFTEKRTDDDIEYTRTDTLEVKEVDLDADFGVYWGEYCDCDGNINDYEVAKHFFELGLKAQKGE